MQLQNARPEELNRIRNELGKPAPQLDQHFDYTIFGDVIKKENLYEVLTVLIHNKTTNTTKMHDTIDVSDIEFAIKYHAEKIVNFLKDLQLEITIEDILNAERDGDIDAATKRLELYRFQHGNSIQLEDIERRLGKRLVPEIGAIETLSRADTLIDLALSVTQKLSRKNRNEFYWQCTGLLRTLSQDEREMYPEPIANIKNKIMEYERKNIRETYTGGIEAAYFRPLLMNSLFGDEMLDYYEDIWGLSLNWIIPVDSESFQLNIRLAYLGFNNHAVQKAEYLDDAAIYGLIFTGGFQYQWMLAKYLFPYIFAGMGYSHFVEYAKDNTAGAALNFGQIRLEAGGGLRVNIPPGLILSANAGASFSVGGIMDVSLYYTFGAGYLFYSEKTMYR